MENTTHHTSGFMRAAIIVAIVITMNLFFNYAISFLYNEPEYNDFIKSTQVVENITTSEACLSVGGQWNQGAVLDPRYAPDLKPTPGYCDVNYTNQKNYEAAKKIYDRNVFITLVILGVISLVAGGFVTISVLSLAFSWGGVLSLVIASIRYWGSADKLIKVLILALALGSLIWLAVKKFNK